MPRRRNQTYTPETRAEALRLIAETGDINWVSRELRIPVSTLRFWRASAHQHFYTGFQDNERDFVVKKFEDSSLSLLSPVQDKKPSANDKEESYYDEIEGLRAELMDRIKSILREMRTTNTDHNYHTLSLARLIDRTFKLDQLIPEHRGQSREFRFIWEDPDGSEHDSPYWERNIIDYPVTLEDGSVWTPPIKNHPPTPQSE